MENYTEEALVPNARQKLYRAKRHIYELQLVLGNFLQTDFYRAEIEDDPETEEYGLQVSMKKELPGEVPLALGDAVHNMRSALDHVATGIVQRSKASAKDVYFPFDETRAGLIARLRNTALVHACPGIDEVIVDQIKPYRDGNTPIWDLNRIDNIDKHRLLVPVIWATEVAVERILDQNGAVYENNVFRVSPGNKLRGFVLSRDAKIDGAIQVQFDVKFPEQGPFGGSSILPTLTHAATAVSEALNVLEQFLAKRASS